MVVGLSVALALPIRDGLGQQLSTKRESSCAMAVGEEAEVADAMEAGGQDVQEEPAHELIGVEGHHLAAALLPIVLPEEADGIVGDGDELAVGDGDTMAHHAAAQRAIGKLLCKRSADPLRCEA